MVHYRLLKTVMDCFAKGQLKPIRVDQVYNASSVVGAFRYMQQGKHIGKIALEIRNSMGQSLVQDAVYMKNASTKLDAASSYLLVGGLGGLGRSVSVWMVQKGARHLTFLSRNAGKGQHDEDFVREIESMGCSVQMVRGSVANHADVLRAVEGTPKPLKGIVQMSMVLRDQMFDAMSIEDWTDVTQPKVQGTWNLHDITSSKGLALDFFVLFSSLSGIIGQVGQANYASANSFLDAFVQYRTSRMLPCVSIGLGAMEDIGYLSNNQDLLRKMKGTGWNPVREAELLEALDFAIMPAPDRARVAQDASSNIYGGTFLLGLNPAIPLSSPDSSTLLRKDSRLAIYHNDGSASSIPGSTNDCLRFFLSEVKRDPNILKSNDAVVLLGTEIGKKLFNLLLKETSDIDLKMSTAELGLDSLVAVELRGWWKNKPGL